MRKIISGKREVILPFLAVFISCVGIVNAYSSTYYYSHPGIQIYLKQAIWLVAGLFVMIAVASMKENVFEESSYVLYAFFIVSLIFVLVFGKVFGGSKRWLSLGPLNIQPSEVGKIFFVLAVSRFFSDRFTTSGMELRDLAVPFLMTLVPFVLIAYQPDLGTAGLYFLIFIGVSVVARLSLKSMVKLGVSGLITVPLLWMMMKGYQKERVVSFMSPEKDPFGTGYHIIQSKIAIGSGGFWGKGFLNGTQGQLRFLPEQHTDFAFSVLAEEWGFIICLVMILLFLFFILRLFYLSMQVQDRYSSFVISGIGIYFLVQVFINFAMVMGLFPVVGVPLPFVSYGGSSMIANMLAVGVVINQSRTRFIL
ncbi:MAG: rod shape-determining protein RodA [Deltaproteobacteria bacterium]|nr:rod shape-determining protein RodA [Deltaproteobacteria bacterium]NIS77442.1 rod shape-determining protein RodA [Deltaproteobacteria bacterium]